MKIIKTIVAILLFGGLTIFCVQGVFAQRPALVSPVIRFSDSSGKPLAFGTLQSFQAGSTVPLATYVDSTTGALNTNPVVLDSTGSATVFLGANVYKLVLKNSAGVVQWTADNIAEGAFQSSYVKSAFGRTGIVVAQNGDYTCSQVTGAICTLPPTPTLYYQTVAAEGTNAAQEPILNFKAAVEGSVVNPVITNGGSGYTGAPTVTFSVAACAVNPTASTNISTGQITNPVVVSGGTGYTTAPTVIFTGGGGTGAAATAFLTSGVVTSIVITNAGTGYTSAPAVTFTGGGGTGASATVTIFPIGSVSSFIINTAGSGCNIAPTVTFSGGGGTGATGTVSLQPSGISCVDNPATTSTDCTFSGGGGGSGGPITQTVYSPPTRQFSTTYTTVQNMTLTISKVSGGGGGTLSIFDGPTTATTLLGQQSCGSGTSQCALTVEIPAGYSYMATSDNGMQTNWVEWVGGGGGGGGESGVSIVTATNANPLFTTTVPNNTTTPQITFALSNANAHTVYGNFSGSIGAPSFSSLTTAMLPFTYTGNTAVLPTATGSFIAGDCLTLDSNFNIIDNGSPCGGGTPASPTGSLQTNAGGGNFGSYNTGGLVKIVSSAPALAVQGTDYEGSGLCTVTGASSITLDGSTCSNFLITLGTNVGTIALTNLVTNQFYTVVYKQDGTGGRTCVNPTGSIGFTTCSSTANAHTKYFAQYDGTNLISQSSGIIY